MSFYSIVLIVAFIILLLTLVAVGIMLQNQDKNKAFPTQMSPCPDGWGVSDTGACVQPVGSNTIDLTKDIDKANWITANDADGNFIPLDSATVCDKKAWANENKVIWDGVSNYNSCS
jgi:hypothetical protein